MLSFPDNACSLRLPRQRRPVGGDVVRVQIAVAVGVLVEVQQLQSRLELARELLVRGVGKLNAAFVLFQLPSGRAMTLPSSART